jgi:multifunctional methyltransferase subunit TRM112
MRLITHNMLQCHVKDCNTNNFPLRFEDAEVELIEAEYNPTFLINMLPKLDWEALVSTAVQVGSQEKIRTGNRNTQNLTNIFIS